MINEGKPLKNISLWAFHGDADDVINVSGSVNMVNAINDNNPNIRAKLTIFPGVNHFSWQKVYDNFGLETGTSNSNPFDMSIYEWMLQFNKEL